MGQVQILACSLFCPFHNDSAISECGNIAWNNSDTSSLDAYEWYRTAVSRHQRTSAWNVALEPKATRKSRGFPSVAAVPVLESVTAAAVVLVLAEVVLLVTAKKFSTVDCWLLFTADLWFSNSRWDLMAFTPIVQSLKAFWHATSFSRFTVNGFQPGSKSFLPQPPLQEFALPISSFFCPFSSLRSEHVATLQWPYLQSYLTTRRARAKTFYVGVFP